MPFVQGHLRDEPLSATIKTRCAHCSRAIRLEIDSRLEHRILEGDEPLVFVPFVDFEKLKDPSIIDGF